MISRKRSPDHFKENPIGDEHVWKYFGMEADNSVFNFPQVPIEFNPIESVPIQPVLMPVDESVPMDVDIEDETCPETQQKQRKTIVIFIDSDDEGDDTNPFVVTPSYYDIGESRKALGALMRSLSHCATKADCNIGGSIYEKIVQSHLLQPLLHIIIKTKSYRGDNRHVYPEQVETYLRSLWNLRNSEAFGGHGSKSKQLVKTIAKLQDEIDELRA